MRKRISIIVIAVFVLALFAGGAYAGQDDSVLSQDIKEADGTTGQDTNTGSGVKTGHIQDGAVTSGKIADGAVATGDIADGAVTDVKITGPISGSKLGSHGHDGADITDGTITTQKVSDGAITDVKITGPISSSKIESTGLAADTVDGLHGSDLAPVVHTHEESDVNGLVSDLANKADVSHDHDGVYQKKYGNVAVVALSGGDYTNPVTAMNDVAAWCGTPSATNPCLLKLMPGVYDIGTNALKMAQYLDIEGSGIGTSKIKGAKDQGLVEGAAYAEIRFLSVENAGNGIESFAIYANGFWAGGVEDFSIRDVEAIAYGGTGKSSGITIYNATYSSNIRIENVTAIAEGPRSSKAFLITSSYVDLINVTALAYGGQYHMGVDIAYATVTMNHVNIKVEGGSSTYGIYNLISTLEMNDVIISSLQGGDMFIGVMNGTQVSATMTNVQMSGVNRGITCANGNNFLSLTNVNISATVDGLELINVGEVTINRSTIDGRVNVKLDAAFTVDMGLSQVTGQITDNGIRFSTVMAFMTPTTRT